MDSDDTPVGRVLPRLLATTPAGDGNAARFDLGLQSP